MNSKTVNGYVYCSDALIAAMNDGHVVPKGKTTHVLIGGSPEDIAMRCGDPIVGLIVRPCKITIEVLDANRD